MDEGHLIAGGTILFTIVIILFSLVVTIVPVVLVFRWIAKMKGENQQLLMTGVPAQARIVQVGATGLTVNDAPQLQLTLEVQPPPGAGYRGSSTPFAANVRALVPVFAMARIQPGQVIAVRFNPHNPTQVAIDFRAMGFAV